VDGILPLLTEIIEEQTDPIEEEAPTPEQGLWPGEEHLPPRTRRALAAIGAWRGLQDDDEFEALDCIRYANPPSPPVDFDDL
jgi:hypothetical protein